MTPSEWWSIYDAKTESNKPRSALTDDDVDELQQMLKDCNE